MTRRLVSRTVFRRLATPCCAVMGLAVLVIVPAGAISAALEPPRKGQALEFMWLTVGDVRELDVSAAFAGSVDSYTATSSNETVVGVSVAGSVVELSASAAGSASVEVRASNAAGSASQRFNVLTLAARPGRSDSARETGVEDSARDTGAGDDMLPLDGEEPPGGAQAVDSPQAGAEPPVVGSDSQPLRIVLSSFAYCRVERPGEVRSYDDPDPVRSRHEVARFGVNYAVFGGRGPYVVSSPHALSGSTDESGVLQMACANPDPDAAGPVYRLDLYNPIDVRVEVTDADGTTASASMVVGRIVATRYIDHGDGTVSVLPRVLRVENPENDYVVATPAAWSLVTLLPNVDLRFAGLSTGGVARFADATGGSEVWVDWTTAAETDRRIVVTADTYSHRVPKTAELVFEMSLMGAIWPWEQPPMSEDEGMMES